MSAAERALRCAGVVALVALALLPLLPLLGALAPPLLPLERACMRWFDLHCHRDPARTLFVASVPLAVCARCSGIYFGLGLGALVRRPALTARALRLWVLGAALWMLLDVLLEQQGLHGSWALLRLFGGFLLAYPLGAVLGRVVLAGRSATPPLHAHSP